MNFQALLNVLNRKWRFRPFLDSVSSHVASKGATRLGRSAGWFAEKLMGGSDSLAIAERVAVNGRDRIADPSYKMGVSLPRMGSMERDAEVSCARCNLKGKCQAR